MKKTINNTLRLFCLLLLPSFGSVNFAKADEDIIQKAQTLIKAKHYQKAYQLLTPIADDYAGNPEFDYIYGLLLLELKHNTLAVLVLERALLMRPQHLATQIALIKAYERLKNYHEANQLLEKAKQHPDFKKITTVEKETPSEIEDFKVSGFLGASVGYDDNLTNGPDDNFIRLPLAEILEIPFIRPLFVGSGLEKDQDFFSTVSGGVSFKTSLPEKFSLNAGIYGNRRVNDRRHDEDTTLFSSWLGGSYQWEKNRYNLTLKQQTIWLSDEHYQDQYSVLGQWSRSFYSSSLLSLYAKGSITRYRNAKNLDADSYHLGAIFYQQFNTFLSPLLSFEVFGGEEQISDAAYDYLGYANIGLSIGSRFKLTASDLVFINASYEHRRYKAINPFFLTERDDNRYNVTGRYTHYFFNNQLGVSLQGTWQLNESSIELYDYQRNFVTVSFQWTF